MRILADESVELEVVEALEREGHDVAYVAQSSAGLDDNRVMDRAENESRVLVTADKDFGEIAFRWRQVSVGVVLMRLRGLATSTKADLVVAALQEHAEELNEEVPIFVLVEPGGTRSRRS